jgi:hypothetical protein
MMPHPSQPSVYFIYYAYRRLFNSLTSIAHLRYMNCFSFPTFSLRTLTHQVAPVSKASADQRAGRAGRVRAGKVYRLYTEVGQLRGSSTATNHNHFMLSFLLFYSLHKESRFMLFFTSIEGTSNPDVGGLQRAGGQYHPGDAAKVCA